MVKNPEKFLETGNLLQQWLRNQNATMYGSPVALSSGLLETDFDQLAQLFQHCLAKYGNRAL